MRSYLVMLVASSTLTPGPALAQTTWLAGWEPDLVAIRADLDITGEVALGVFFPPGSALIPPTMARSLPGCSWTSESPGELRATCRNMLPKSDGRIDALVDFAPAVRAAQQAGARNVVVTARVERWPGQRLDVAGGWSVQTEDEVLYEFTAKPGVLPPPLRVQLGDCRPAPPLPIRAFAFLALVPGVWAWIAGMCARRSNRAAGLAIWLPGLNVALMAGWMSIWPPTVVCRYAERLRAVNWPIRFLTAWLLIFSVPVAAKLIAVAAEALWDPAGRSLGGLGNLSRMVALLVTFDALLPGLLAAGLAFSGIESNPAATLLCLFVLLGVFLFLAWAFRRRSSAVESPELTRRLQELAARLSATTARVMVVPIQSGLAVAAPVLAQVILSRLLIEKLTKREVDSLLAHESAHLRQPVATLWLSFPFLYVMFFLAAMQMLPRALFWAAEPWVWLPALGTTLAWTAFRRRAETAADLYGAWLTGDPHGMIAALARVHQMQRLPSDWGRWPGVLMPHPSLRNRVLTLAAHYQFPRERALEIMEHPDVLRGPGDEHYPLPPVLAGGVPRAAHA